LPIGTDGNSGMIHPASPRPSGPWLLDPAPYGLQRTRQQRPRSLSWTPKMRQVA